MGKYIVANPTPLVNLKFNPYQVAFLDALRLRVCPLCQNQFSIQFSVVDTLLCPACGTKGERAYVELLLRAGRQGGKTRIGTLACALEMSFPGAYGWICAPTYRDQELFVKPAFFKQIPQTWLDNGDWQASNDLFIAPNGAQVAFVSLDNPDAVRGPTLDFLLIDEACKVSSKVRDVAAPAMSINRGVMIYTTTPKGEDWVHEQIWIPAENGEPGFWAAAYKSIDNPIQDPEFIERQRRTMSPEMFRQEYEASIESFQGAIYGDLLTKCVTNDPAVLERFLPECVVNGRFDISKLDRSRSAIVGLDPGSDHPFAGCLIVVTPAGLVVCGEYRQREKPAAIHAQSLHAMRLGLNPRWLIDRSQAQMIIELAQHGIFAQPAENSVTAGIERVKSWMLSGQFVIVKALCPLLCKELASYRWAETEKADGSVGLQMPYKKRDDLCDALRYALMGWPHLPEPTVAPGGRDLSTLPEKMARDIERMMRGQKQKPVEDGTGEFYERVVNEGEEFYSESVATGGYDEFYA